MSANKRFFLIVGSLFLSGFIWNAAPQKVEEGNRLFEKKDYEGALRKYGEAQEKNPLAPEVPFNMGNSFYRQNRFEEAIRSHSHSIELGSDALKAKAHYNIGNSLYRKGDSQGALEAYKKAIDLDPNDIDTKYNIEFIQRKQEESSQSQKSQSQQEEKPKPTEEQKGEAGGEGKEKEQKQISKKDAERLLGSLQTEEKSLPKEKQKIRRSQEEPPLKDW